MQVQNSEPILKLSNVGKSFGGLRAVDEVDLVIRKGELHCLIGPNGAGKSTIFKMIMGIFDPSDGQILYKGKSLAHMKKWDRFKEGISIKMQVPGVFGDLTVYENLRIAAQRTYSKKALEEKINYLLEEFNLTHLKGETVNNLSHGQQQSLEMGMAIANDPTLLLLDEPVAGMGPEETQFISNLIKKINNNGITILFIDHDMEFVRSLAQQVTVLHLGKKFAEGTIEDIENNEKVVEIYLGQS
ncbi:ABC transporter ATP-binding protein [Solibacillus sp. A46]|uniref:ABC transporter ATP-binding protein n=1 Tax=Solibacillus faecavium TaxID=2762221 RepID=A0ABR8Y2G4_9BACL|nr:ABC transporter ATP-binding protein [Solibacillus faecavium]MBD8038400.1 ABC transporter ATP-binding protein [Solibacillus faecavium]